MSGSAPVGRLELPMTTKVIGLDVGTSAVRAVELELRDPVRVLAIGQVGLPAGAVVEGEVVDVEAVADALRRLWDGGRFSGRTVRVAMSSARVIVRTIEMPRLSHSDLLSAIRLQLDDYVPLPPDETVFDVRSPDGADAADPTQELIFAATDRDAARGLVEAIRAADLKVAAVDVAPAALALALTSIEPEPDESVDMLISVGAGTVVVVAARGGEPKFSRILTNVSGRLITEGIARNLAVEAEEAERYKRLPSGDPMSDTAVAAAAMGVDDVVAEVFDSITFYAGQPDALPVRRVFLTGGGSLLPGLATSLTERLGLDVLHADPFADLEFGETGFEVEDRPYLAPYMAAAIGAALAGGRPKGRRIDLTPSTKVEGQSAGRRRVLAIAGVVVVLGAGGMFYVQGRGELAEEQERASAAQAALVDLQAQANPPEPAAEAPAVSAADPADVIAAVAPRMIDWVAVENALEAGAAPFAIVVSSFEGTLEPADAPVVDIPIDPGTVDGAAEAGTTEPAATEPGAATLPSGVGRLNVAITAPDVDAVADWLDSLHVDPRFDDPMISGLNLSEGADGAPSVQFTMTLVVTDENLLDAALQAVPG